MNPALIYLEYPVAQTSDTIAKSVKNYWLLVVTLPWLCNKL